MASIIGFIFAFLVALVAILPSYHLIYNSNTPVCLWGHCFSFPQSSCTGRQNTYHTNQEDGFKPASPFALGSPPIVFSPQVWAALESGQPVVALESTIITHGMPYPANVETALAVEAAVWQHGAVAATVAVLNGRVHVGLTRGQLTALALLGPAAKKCSRRDISALVAHAPLSPLSSSSSPSPSVSTDADSTEPELGAGTGATTVAATAYLARLAHPDLRVFVTGGIGGVHRGWESSLDVSADLTELGRTDITVVCAGAKSILDIPATLEYLETQGVTVVGYQTDYFPSFFTSKSGVKVPYRADSPSEIARMINANRIMRVQSGMVVGVPISSADELNSQHIESAIKEALAEAKDRNMSGKDITPFLLEKVNNLTKGDSLKANINIFLIYIQLILQNARVGAQIAKELSTLLSSLRAPLTTETTPSSVPTIESVGHVAVFGGAVVDLVATPFNPLVMGASNPGKLYQGMGGVARNIAEGLARLLSTTRPQTLVQFVSALGYDAHGDILLSHSNKLNISMKHSLRVKEQSTAVYQMPKLCFLKFF